MRIGSLCTGIAGLELGLRLAGVDTETVFVSDIDPGACDWLDQAMPTVQNLGDFTAYDELPEVDIITAGFPCQPFSTAGKRQGLTDERYLFDDIARLVGRMGTRPLLFLENVPGLLTSVSNGEHAMARVVHGLAAIGYHITWGTLPAAAVGAPHRRNRWWGLAYPQNTDSQFGNEWGFAASRQTESGRARSDASGRSRTPPADTDRTRLERRSLHAERSDERAARPRSLDALPDTQSAERRGPQQQAVDSAVGPAAESGERDRTLADRFGAYAPAIARWERILGRLAPDPTVTGRLNPAFVEWMMGYPEGWVTDILPSRNQALHALGNAVVPQCAAAAFTQLCTR